MLENISDYLSFGVLVAIPISWIVWAGKRFFLHRRAKLLANQGKFYREW